MSIKFKAGTGLVSEGDHGRKMFIIQKGKARVYKTYMGQRITLAILGEGEIFGELSFFDAEPRSASVEALTDLEAVVVDGANTSKEIAGLPSWVTSVMKTTFKRFREADAKITLLQSLSEYQRRAFKKNVTSQAIYLELLRFIKTFKLVMGQRAVAGSASEYDSTFKEMDELLGTRVLGLRTFWKQLENHGIIDLVPGQEAGKQLVQAHLESLDCFNDYLHQEIKSERFLILSRSAVAVLRKVVGFTHPEAAADGSKKSDEIVVNHASLGIKNLAFQDEALNELFKYSIFKKKSDTELLVNPELVSRHYVYQDILKGFDHTEMRVD